MNQSQMQIALAKYRENLELMERFAAKYDTANFLCCQSPDRAAVTFESSDLGSMARRFGADGWLREVEYVSVGKPGFFNWIKRVDGVEAVIYHAEKIHDVLIGEVHPDLFTGEAKIELHESFSA